MRLLVGWLVFGVGGRKVKLIQRVVVDLNTCIQKIRFLLSEFLEYFPEEVLGSKSLICFVSFG